MTEESSARRSLIAANAKQIREIAPQLATTLTEFSERVTSEVAANAMKQMAGLTFVVQETLELLIAEVEQAQEQIKHDPSYLRIIVKEEPDTDD